MKTNRIHQYLRKELVKITTERFCKRHNIKSIKEYQEKLYKEIENV